MVGLADGYDSALELIRQITEEVFAATQSVDIRHYILQKHNESIKENRSVNDTYFPFDLKNTWHDPVRHFSSSFACDIACAVQFLFLTGQREHLMDLSIPHRQKQFFTGSFI